MLNSPFWKIILMLNNILNKLPNQLKDFTKVKPMKKIFMIKENVQMKNKKQIDSYKWNLIKNSIRTMKIKITSMKEHKIIWERIAVIVLLTSL